MIINPGFWPTTYWSDRYWVTDYWPGYELFVVGLTLLLSDGKIYIVLATL